MKSPTQPIAFICLFLLTLATACSSTNSGTRELGEPLPTTTSQDQPETVELQPGPPKPSTDTSPGSTPEQPSLVTPTEMTSFVTEFLEALAREDFTGATLFVDSRGASWPGVAAALPGPEGATTAERLRRFCLEAHCKADFEVVEPQASFPFVQTVVVNYHFESGLLKHVFELVWSDGQLVIETLPPPLTSAPSALGLRWTVIGVESNDSLNIRADPNPDGAIVGDIPAWSNLFIALDETMQNRHGRWRLVKISDGTQGWVNARFLVAQPLTLTDEDQRLLTMRTDAFVTWVGAGMRSGANTGINRGALATGAIWVGGLGIYAEVELPWTWIPSSTLTHHSDWTATRTFEIGFDDCGSMCEKSLQQFFAFGGLHGDTATLINDIGSGSYRDGAVAFAPAELHRVVLDQPADPELPNWRRIHFIFDWSTGEPLVALVHTYGWTP